MSLYENNRKRRYRRKIILTLCVFCTTELPDLEFMKIKIAQKRIVYLLLLLSVSLQPDIVSLLKAQGTISFENLDQIRVDQLTDSQIQSFITQMQSTGMSMQQLEQMAAARGMPASEISKLRRRILDLRPDLGGMSISRGRNEFFDPRGMDVETNQLMMLDTAQGGLKIFGSDLFDHSKLSFEPSVNIPIPSDYIVGPKDEILIDIWGSSEQTYQLDVSPEGFIFIRNLGPVHVSGLTVDECTKRIKSRLTKIYAGLVERGGRLPNTYAQVSLGNLRNIKVHAVGQVKYAGTFTLSSLSTLFNALYYAGGPAENGSMRQIELIRDGVNVATLDTYKLLRGDRSQSIRLEDQDVIIVRPYLNRVTVGGEVKRPAIYETKENESMGELIAFAGGFTENAYSYFLTIKRNTGRNRSVETVRRENFDSFILNGGDEILVEAVSNRFSNRVQIQGAVHRPGDFELTDGLTLSQLIKQADGLTGDAFIGRGIIVRTEDDYTLSSIEFKVHDVINQSTADISLKNEDVVHIKSIFDLREDYKVTIEGEVKNPGEFDYVKEMTVEDLILIADGLRESASKSSVEVARRIKSSSSDELSSTAELYNFSISSDLSLSHEASTFQLQPFDLVIIRKDPAYEEQLLIEIEGEVIYPGKYSLAKKNERISDVLLRAGGLTKFAYTKGATLIRRTEFYLDEDDRSAKRQEETKNGNHPSGERINTGTNSTAETAATIDDPDEIRRQRLQELSRSTNIEFKTHEFIGIDLDKIIKDPGSKYDVILREGDIFSVPRQLQTVRLRGELLYPITTRHDPTYSFKNYISQAGGFSSRAKKGKTYVVYASGTAERTKSFFWFKNYPKIEPGAEIFVPQKPPKRRLTAGEIAGIATSFVSLAILLDNFIDRNIP